MASQTLSGWPSVTDSDVKVKAPSRARSRAAVGSIVVVWLIGVLLVVKSSRSGRARPAACGARRRVAERQLAAVHRGVVAQDLVPPSPGFREVRRAQGEPHALLVPGRQVDGEGDP